MTAAFFFQVYHHNDPSVEQRTAWLCKVDGDNLIEASPPSCAPPAAHGHRLGALDLQLLLRCAALKMPAASSGDLERGLRWQVLRGTSDLPFPPQDAAHPAAMFFKP